MLSVDHVGYAVKKMERTLKALELLGYTFGDVIADSDRKINICFGEMNGYRIELVCPQCAGSPVDDVILKLGNTPYHLCYCSDSLEEDLRDLIKGGYKVVIPAQEAVAFDGKRVVFLYSLAVGLIEIVEK